MQNHFLPVAPGRVAVAKAQITDHLARCLIAGSCLSAITVWLLCYRLAVGLISR